MKGIKVESGIRTKILIALGIVVLLAIGIGLFIGYEKLRAVYLRQFEVKEPATQIVIESGRMVKSDVIAEFFGLRQGCNLAEIDFVRKREQILEKIFTLKDVRIVRKLPGQVYIVAEERTPTARLSVRGFRGTTGKVVDSEGVVFICQRGTQMLPTIRETAPKGSAPGSRLVGNSRAALELIELVRTPGFTEIVPLEVDASREDFLVATLADYSTVKICWEGMGKAPTPESRAALKSRIDCLVKSMRSNVSSGVKVWNATMPGLIFADTQEKVQ